MMKIDRVTFTDGKHEEEIEKQGRLYINDYAKIKFVPSQFPKKDVRNWMIVASYDGEVRYTGEVIDVRESTDIMGTKSEYFCLPAVTHDD